MGVPTTTLRKVRYVHQISVNPGPGELVGESYRLMDPTDPDDSGTHAAMGMNEIIALYKNWKVVGAKITLRENNHGTGNVNPYKFWLKIQDDTVNHMQGLDHLSTWLEQNSDRQGNCLWTGNIGWSMAGNNQITKYFSARKFQGRTPKVSDGDWNGEAWVGPTIDAYLYVYGIPMNTTYDPGNQSVILQIDYIVKCYHKDYIQARQQPQGP